MKKNKSFYLVITTFLLTSVLWCSLYNIIYLKSPVAHKVAEAYEIISKEYIHQYDEEQVKDFTIAAMVASLGDDYSAFYNKEYYKSLEERISGHYYGIGITISPDVQNDVVRITDVTPDTPADKAGIEAGDIILYVEDYKVTTQNYADAVNIIKNTDPEKNVKITLISNKTGKEYLADVSREEIITLSVKGSLLENGIAYIKITTFNNETHKEFLNTVADIGVNNIKSIILDLRNNGGGTLFSTKNIADLIMPETVITTFRYKNGEEVHIKTSGKRILNVPVTVIVNGESASASEVLTSAIQDNGVGKVVGEKTFGKAVAQQTYPFETENGKTVSALYLTSASYLTPGGKDINGVGITPDYIVAQSEEDDDAQLTKAIEIARESITEEEK